MLNCRRSLKITYADPKPKRKERQTQTPPTMRRTLMRSKTISRSSHLSAQMSAAQKAAWLNARCGLLTASRMAEALGKKGPAARRKLIMELVEERVTGQSVRHVV